MKATRCRVFVMSTVLALPIIALFPHLIPLALAALWLALRDHRDRARGYRAQAPKRQAAAEVAILRDLRRG